jgi:hypothetical protein
MWRTHSCVPRRHSCRRPLQFVWRYRSGRIEVAGQEPVNEYQSQPGTLVEHALTFYLEYEGGFRQLVQAAPIRGPEWVNGMERAIASLREMPGRCPVVRATRGSGGRSAEDRRLSLECYRRRISFKAAYRTLPTEIRRLSPLLKPTHPLQ